jgi:hypothetical protein
MISTKIAALLTAVALAVGLVVGGAGTIFAGDGATGTMPTADCLEHMQQYGTMMSGSSGMMGGLSGMMGGSSGMMGQGGATMPDWMQLHHGGYAPGTTR